MARRLLTLLLLPLLPALAGCRGDISEKPPIHINPNMDDQPRFDPQEVNLFFSDNRAMRPLVPGTVAREHFKPPTPFYTGRDEAGAYVLENPLFEEGDETARLALMQRGQDRYQIYCAVCHDRTGSGRGLVMPPAIQGFPPPPAFNDDRVRLMANGEIFNVITNGVRNMPSYRYQVNERDRWAIIAYLRALQRSQRTTFVTVPAELRGRLDVAP